MTINWDNFTNDVQEELNGTSFVINQLDHEINFLLQQRQAIMAKDVNPLVVQMDDILSSLNPASFGGEYLYKSDWYKNLDLESWGIYKYVSVGNKEGIDDDTILVDSLNGITTGSELLIEIDTGEKVPRTVKKTEYSDYYEGYLIYLEQEDATWDRKYMPDALYPKCIDPINEKACVAYNPCSDEFYKLPEWDENLPEFIDSTTVPLEVKFGVAPYTWTLLSGELDGWSLKNETTNDRFNTLYSVDTCELPAIVQVTDYCGNKTDEYVVINVYTIGEMTLNGPEIVTPGDDIYLSVKGGTPPYTWLIEELPRNTQCENDMCETLHTTSTSGDNIIHTSLYSCGYVVVSVTDRCNGKETLSISFDNVEWKKIYWFNTGDYGVKYSSSSHYEYDPVRFKDWPYNYYASPSLSATRPVLMEIRAFINGYLTPDFLKEPIIYEMSEKLWNIDTNMIPQEYGEKIYPFPEYGYIKGENTEPWKKQFNNGFDVNTLPGGNYEWIETSNYYATTYFNNYKIYESNGPYTTYCTRTSQTDPSVRTCNDPDLISKCSYQKWWVRDDTYIDYRARRESTAALSLNPKWKIVSLGKGGYGTKYGYWPFYCQEGYDDVAYSNPYYYTQTHKELRMTTFYVKACRTDNGYWKYYDGEYHFQESWITVQ